MVLIIRDSGESAKDIIKIINLQFKNLYSIKVAQKGKKFKGNKETDDVIFEGDWKDHFQRLLFIRSLLVQLSTGSFVLSGKVYKNKMIDLRITNKKLFLRAIRIINHITKKDENDIKEALLRSIYEGDVPSQNNLEDTIALSAGRENIVPMAIPSLVYPGKNIEELRLMLRNEPIVRKLVIEELSNLK